MLIKFLEYDIQKYGMTESVAGSPCYLSPQIIDYLQYVRENEGLMKYENHEKFWDSFKADVFSLGLTLLQMVTQRDVFELNKDPKKL